MDYLLISISKIAKEFNLSLETCSEDEDLLQFGIVHGKCVDDILIEKITGKKFKKSKKDPNQRACCGCVESVDIGAYNTCLHGCQYCYATYNTNQTFENFSKHDPKSLFLIGTMLEKDNITTKKHENFNGR